MQDILQSALNYDSVLKRVKEVCLSCGRNPSEIQVLPVVKYASVQQIAGFLSNRRVPFVAESRLQDSLRKWSSKELAPYKGIKKFFIGHIQKNKVSKIIENFDMLCSVDGITLAHFIDTKAQEAGKVVECLVQIKLTEKDTQGGLLLGYAQDTLTEIKSTCPHLCIKGLMAIAPQGGAGEIRDSFLAVKRLFDNNFSTGSILSLGMSDDFELAIEAGSTLIRIGSAIFDLEGVNDN